MKIKKEKPRLKFRKFPLKISILALIVFFAGIFLFGERVKGFAEGKLMVRGNYFFNGGTYDLEKAAKYYKIASFVDEKASYPHYQLARVYFLKADYENGLTEIDRALSLNPDNKRAFYTRGLIDGYAKNYEAAEEDFQKFVAWAPKEWAGYNDLAWIYYQKKDYQKAVEVAQKGLEVAPDNAWLLNGLGVSYTALGKKEEGKVALDKAASLSKNLTASDWKMVNPGDDAEAAPWDLAQFKTTVNYNLNLASDPFTLAKGKFQSACGSSLATACSGVNCTQILCDPDHPDDNHHCAPGFPNSQCIPACENLKPCSSDQDCCADTSWTPSLDCHACNGSAQVLNGLVGDYFDNKDLTNLKLSLVDDGVSFNWGSGSPDPSIGKDTFSARWQGQVQPQYSGNYSFLTYSDDGVRLWVNGSLIINNWTDHGPTFDLGSINLVANQKYDIKMEYYENTGDARISLLWSKMPQLNLQTIPASRLFTYPVAACPIIQTSNCGRTRSKMIVACNNNSPTISIIQPKTNNLDPGDLFFEWNFSDPDPGDTQSRYVMGITCDKSGNRNFDQNSSATSRTVSGFISQDDCSWTIKAYDSSGAESNTDTANFRIKNSPTCSISCPDSLTLSPGETTTYDVSIDPGCNLSDCQRASGSTKISVSRKGNQCEVSATSDARYDSAVSQAITNKSGIDCNTQINIQPLGWIETNP